MKQRVIFLKFMIASLFSLLVLLPTATLAQDSFPKAISAKWVTKTLPKVVITGIKEDSLIIGQKKYLFTHHTAFLKKSQKKETKISDSDLIFPSRARITYRVYTVSDEGHPFRKDQRVLTKVSLY